jgi:hypothetical protein
LPPTRTALLALASALAAAGAAAQDRPGEDDVFGAPAAQPPKPAEGKPAAGKEPQRPTEADVFGKPAEPAGAAGPAGEERVREELRRTEDPLKLGGLLYLRSILAATDEGPASHGSFTTPALLDLYLDARPSDRVRGFALARTFYDATLPRSDVPYQYRSPLSRAAALQSGANPRAVLDQLWLRFDLDQRVFLTAGRQHVKWGVGRFWNPTDYLHVARRDPLAVFDERAGTTMLKVHVPWEARAWNFYAFAIAEPLVPPPALPGLQRPPEPPNELGAVGGAARAEVVLGGWEVGIDGAAQRGMEPRLGLDASTGIWEIDVRGEVSLRRGADLPRLRNLGTADAPSYALETVGGLRTAAVGAAEWQHKYSDEDTYTIGAEYFWNQNGYGDPQLYLPVLAAGLGTPFYLGRHYAGAYLLLPKPGSWNLHTFTFSLLGNLSDRSFIGRLDWSVTMLTYLTLEAYLAGHAGPKGGEFRFGFDWTSPRTVSLPPVLYPVCTGLGGALAPPQCTIAPPFRQAAPLFDAGVALRMSL